MTPLHYVARYSSKYENRKRMCKFLIDNGADKNHRDLKGKTPLCYAAEFYRLDICRILITNGLETTPEDNNGQYTTFSGLEYYQPS